MSRAASLKSPWQIAIDPMLGLVSAALLLIGLVMVASSSVAIADRDLGSPHYYLNRQLVFLLLGLAGATIALITPTRAWERLSVVALVFALVLLAVICPPNVVNDRPLVAQDVDEPRPLEHEDYDEIVSQNLQPHFFSHMH